MRIFVTDWLRASYYVPHSRALAIRITDPGTGFSPLRQSEKWKREGRFYFTDTTPVTMIEDEIREKGCLTGEIARDIITFFGENKGGVEETLIHCRAGLVRSPAVGLALSDIFGPYDVEIDNPKYRDWINLYVLDTMHCIANVMGYELKHDSINDL